MTDRIMGTPGMAEFSDAFARTGAKFWLQRVEVQVLRGMLQPGETVDIMTFGRVVVSGLPAVRRWLIAVTNMRLICIKGQDARARQVIDVPFRSIGSVTDVFRFIDAEVVIATAHGRIRISLPKPQAAALSEALILNRPALAEPPSGSLVLHGSASPAGAHDARVAALEETVDRLEEEISAMRQQVDFLEDLLRDKARTTR